MLKSTDISTTPTFNWLKSLYLLLAIAGTIEPWFWLLQDPPALSSPTLLFQRAFANNVSIELATDLLISEITFLCFVWIELKRLQLSRLWIFLYAGLILGIGLSCSLPLFLYHRAQLLE